MSDRCRMRWQETPYGPGYSAPQPCHENVDRLFTKLRTDVAARDATIAELTAERDALRKDAERYRWLCAFPPNVQAVGLARVALAAFNSSEPKHIVDAAIDAALSDTAGSRT